MRAARAEFEAVLSAQKDLLREDHPDLLQRQELGERHAHIFDTRHHLALLEYDRRRFGLAEEGFRKVMDDQTELLGARHPDTLRTRRNRALAIRDQGDTAEAARELRAVTYLQERTLGADHDETSQTRRNLGELMTSISDAGIAADV